ncbi:FixH family protein [Massilia sp. G4R7]|uniref:FixH family protein n=1 Tax=Massilia phyllostachyos TaxID=2898585 RepID=A0ABS8QAA7_9BURK|nr:FixH family protein [Massilia phyllostachyos]MCD2518493.1 FixH family protein [Massilia phyllostachyos]
MSTNAPWYRHRWPWFLMIGPVAVVVAGAITTWLALSRPDAMVVGDYYKQGKAINQELRRDREATRLDLAFEAAYEREKLKGRLTSHGQALVAPFHIRLAHPTLPERDRVLEALPDARGRFSAAAPGLQATNWQVVIEGGTAQGAWRLARSWRPNKEATLLIRADRE